MTDDQRDSLSDSPAASTEDPTTPAQGGSSGGNLQREIGVRDEEKTSTGADPQPTSVRKGDKANEGDEPNLPNRDGGGQADRVQPRST